MTTLLPLRPLPFPLESAIGYLLRLGAANDLHSLTWVQTYRKYMALPAQSFEDFIGRTTGHGPDVLQNLWGPSSSDLLFQPSKKLGIKTTYWSLDHRRWCPDCLREQGYWKTEWLITLQVACPTHRRLLHEHCPACLQAVGWYSGGLNHCRCGQALTTGAFTAISSELQQITQLISDKLTAATDALPQASITDNDLTKLVKDVRLPRLLDLLWGLGCYGHYRALKKSLKVHDHHRLAVALPVLESATQMLAQWPRPFHALMLESCDLSQTQALHLHVFIGPHLQALTRALNHPELHFVRVEYERFVTEHWKGVIADRHRFTDAITAEHSMILAKEAAEILGISRRKLVTLVDQGHIQGLYQQSKGNLRFLVVNRNSVLRFQKGSAGALFTLMEAATYLGVTHPRIRLFVDAGLLTPAYRPAGNNERHVHWAFEKSELDKLLDGLRIQMHATPECASLISLEKITRARSRDGADMVTLLQAIQAGELDCVASEPCRQGINGILLNSQQFESWFAARLQTKQIFLISPAARYLGLKEHVLYWLRDRELLYGFVYLDGACKPSLPREALDRLKKRYVWGRALGQLTGYGEKSASLALINRGVLPITGPTVDGGTTYLFLRSDVMAYLDRSTQQQQAIT